MTILANDPRVSLMNGGNRRWWDVQERAFINASTIYIPFGCPDWGETGGKRNTLCTFCPLPNAVIDYRKGFYDNGEIPIQDHLDIFILSLQAAVLQNSELHTLMIFNAGSFLAMDRKLQEVVANIAAYPNIQRVVIESRAALITRDAVQPLAQILHAAGKKLTIRIGIETQDDSLRNRQLAKGHSRKQLHQAVEVMQEHQVTSGGYVLLNPAPGLDQQWAMAEAMHTINWILGDGEEQLGMDEVYFCSTNVGPNTVLTRAWESGQFTPANLWMVLRVLQSVLKYGPRVHLLPFRDEPELLAVSSNHNPKGIFQNLSNATGCDSEFHSMFDEYRSTMEAKALYTPECACRPSWF